ncbi:MAG TPA: thiamine phosphate synthase, partial [Candidatus Kapabacteria bacterium]|nr:thiamine phosphate synthase [Candidatus Kapabacteria bacterium]
MFKLPKLYPILDTACFSKDEDIYQFAHEVIAGGATLLQYRNKSGNARIMLEHAQELQRICGSSVRLIMNDRADLCLAARFDGCHVGQDDLSPEAARKIIGQDLVLGVSTHNPEQLSVANRSSADYVAIGPVFQTASKANPDPVVGLDGVRQARELTKKPIVAIGGITRANCREVIVAGADSIAVIGDLVREPKKSVQEFL